MNSTISTGRSAIGMTVVVVVVVIVIVIGTLALAMVSTTNADRSTALTAPSTS